jgi:hypothetical protein
MRYKTVTVFFAHGNLREIAEAEGEFLEMEVDSSGALHLFRKKKLGEIFLGPTMFQTICETVFAAGQWKQVKAERFP